MKIRRINHALLPILAVLFMIAPAIADVKLPAIIGNNMVLQQDSKAPIWGWAEPGEKITVKGSWMWMPASTKADKDGKWMVKIKTSKKPGPHTIDIKANNSIKIENVLMGEVWVCSGQSNMEMGIAVCDNAQEEIAAANYPDIRIFDVARKISAAPVDNCDGSWSPCTPETIKAVGTWGGFSAAGYYFGRELHKELNIPIGLIATNWGGTPAEAWTSKETLEKMPDFAQTVKAISELNEDQLKDKFAQQLDQWYKKIDTIDTGSKEGFHNTDFDDSQWKTMDQPKPWSQTELADFDGVVWYRSKVNLPPSWARKDQTLKLGPIDDIDTVWVNGVQIGHTENWSTPREYTIPASALKVGPNIVAIRVIDTQGEGGIYGTKEQMIIKPVGTEDKVGATVAGPWKYQQTSPAKDLPQIPQISANFNQNSPTALYNGMLAPIIPFAIKGAIWYQGESNAYRAYQYRTLFPAMINDWRKKWDQGDFPFYYVQIAPYKYGQNVPSEELREAQLLTLKTKNTGMAVTWDIGNINDIHPTNKQDVGKRLALWALVKTYDQKGIVYSGPLYIDYKIEGDKIRLFFDHVGQGLVAKDGPLTHFTIAGPDRKFVEAKAVIDSDSIIVSSDQIKSPSAVRFAWSNTDEPNLFNKEGLPASSFRTDHWPAKTMNNK